MAAKRSPAAKRTEMRAKRRRNPESTLRRVEKALMGAELPDIGDGWRPPHKKAKKKAMRR